jgi:RNA polymerase sigma-70 factor (ECF subfamily)
MTSRRFRAHATGGSVGTCAGATEDAPRPGRPPEADVCIRIVEAEFDYVFRTLRRLGASVADAQDLTQEVFLVMWRRRGDWDPERSLRPWLWGVAHRVARDHHRRSLRERPAGLLDVPDDEVRGEDRIAALRARGLVLEAIGALPDKQRAVLVLHELEGIPVREVASRLGLPLFTVYTRLRTARKSFARAVRRLQLRVSPTDALAPEALLAAERPLPPAPAGARRRVGERLRAIFAGDMHDQPPPTARSWPAAGAAALAAVAVLAFLAARSTPFLSGGRGAGRALTGRRAVAATSAVVSAAGQGAGVPAGPLARGLVARWAFDEPSGSRVARDAAGGGVDCELHELPPGSHWVAGVKGGAIDIAGRGWLECPNVKPLAGLSREVTVAAWVRMIRLRPDLASIAAWQRSDGQEFTFFMGLNGDRLLLAGAHWGRVEWTMPPVIGRWVHVAGTRSADGSRRLYFNGQEVAHNVQAPVVQPLAPGAGALIIGGRAKSSEPRVVRQRLDGAIDELVIYDRALGPREIAALAAPVSPAPH